MKERPLATLRWEAELRRAAERGLLTTRQAADRAGVPPHMVRHWKSLGLINDFGGGKGYPSLFDPGEVLTAPSRRKNLRLGWRGRPVSDAERAAEKRLASGKHITLPTSAPFRMLAYSCRKCGELVTCKDPRKSVPRAYYPHVCYIEAQRERGRDPERMRVGHRAQQLANSRTLETANRNGYEWTGPELEVASRADLTARQVALMLGRTIFAVRTQRAQLKVDPRKQRLAGSTVCQDT